MKVSTEKFNNLAEVLRGIDNMPSIEPGDILVITREPFPSQGGDCTYHTTYVEGGEAFLHLKLTK